MAPSRTTHTGAPLWARVEADPARRDFFVFLFFIFVFYKNIFSFSKFTEIYPVRPAAGRPGPGRPAAGRQGFFCKNFRGEFALRPLEDRLPGNGTAGCPSTI